jgi:hypothetical protein
MSQGETGKLGKIGFSIDMTPEAVDSKTIRLIDWQADVLHRLLKQIVAKRIHEGRKVKSNGDINFNTNEGETVLDEVKEIITLPQSKSAHVTYDINSIFLDPKVTKQLTDYVTVVASMYRDNPCKLNHALAHSEMYMQLTSICTAFFHTKSIISSMHLMLRCRWSSCCLESLRHQSKMLNI